MLCLTLSRTIFSLSVVIGDKAGNTRAAISRMSWYCCVAYIAITPADRAGGNGSRKARTNAGIRTFFRV